MKVHSLLLLFILCTLVVCQYKIEVYPSSTPEKLANAPFALDYKFFEDKLGIEISIKPTNLIIKSVVKNVYLGAIFPPCSSIFETFIDFRDWDKLKIPEKRFSKQIDINIPRICLSDLPIVKKIDYITLCVKVKDIAILPRGITGSIVADISIGVDPLFAWKEEDIELYSFKIGQVEDCFLYKTREDCLTKNETCGWCADTNQCLIARADKKTDVCKFCNRCSFQMNLNDPKSECLSKRSCGWCNLDEKCYPGDDIGPFTPGVKCESNQVLSNQIHENIDWEFSVEKQNDNDPNTKNIASKNMGLGILIGIIIASVIIGTIAGIGVTVKYILNKKKESNVSKYVRYRK